MLVKRIKFIFYIISGGVGGWLCTILFFIHENSVIRDVPTWGMILSVITSLIGAIIFGVHYYGELFENHEQSSDKDT